MMPASIKDADFETWLKANPAPTLQELLDTYGTWGLIPPEAWDAYIKILSQWEDDRRNRLPGIPRIE